MIVFSQLHCEYETLIGSEMSHPPSCSWCSVRLYTLNVQSTNGFVWEYQSNAGVSIWKKHKGVSTCTDFCAQQLNHFTSEFPPLKGKESRGVRHPRNYFITEENTIAALHRHDISTGDDSQKKVMQIKLECEHYQHISVEEQSVEGAAEGAKKLMFKAKSFIGAGTVIGTAHGDIFEGEDLEFEKASAPDVDESQEESKEVDPLFQVPLFRKLPDRDSDLISRGLLLHRIGSSLKNHLLIPDPHSFAGKVEMVQLESDSVIPERVNAVIVAPYSVTKPGKSLLKSHHILSPAAITVIAVKDIKEGCSIVVGWPAKEKESVFTLPRHFSSVPSVSSALDMNQLLPTATRGASKGKKASQVHSPAAEVMDESEDYESDDVPSPGNLTVWRYPNDLSLTNEEHSVSTLAQDKVQPLHVRFYKYAENFLSVSGQRSLRQLQNTSPNVLPRTSEQLIEGLNLEDYSNSLLVHCHVVKEVSEAQKVAGDIIQKLADAVQKHKNARQSAPRGAANEQNKDEFLSLLDNSRANVDFPSLRELHKKKYILKTKPATLHHVHAVVSTLVERSALRCQSAKIIAGMPLSAILNTFDVTNKHTHTGSKLAWLEALLCILNSTELNPILINVPEEHNPPGWVFVKALALMASAILQSTG